MLEVRPKIVPEEKVELQVQLNLDCKCYMGLYVYMLMRSKGMMFKVTFQGQRLSEINL